VSSSFTQDFFSHETPIVALGASQETLVDVSCAMKWETWFMTDRARLFVTLEGYAVEGGFDQVGEPATCYSPTIALGRHAGPGGADDLWHHYEYVLDFVPGLGFDGVRLSLEWTRIEPRADEVDPVALSRYLEVVRHARSLGLDVTVVVIDGVWPAWLGQEAWLLPWVAPYVLAHSRRVVEHFGDDITGVLAFAQPQELVTNGYLSASAPPWRRSALIDASFAHAQIGRIMEELREDDVVGAKLVTSSTVVSLDSAPEDLLAARDAFVGSEIYVRSLLRGAGPTSVSAGLLVRSGDQWRVSASDELLSALR
jgi:beta-glucosidase/6-phospho-beta-glucosidase/beta-galactosidase